MDNFFEHLRNKDKNAIKSLLEKGTSPNIKNQTKETALHLLSQEKYFSAADKEIIKLLIFYGVLIDLKDNQGNTALNIACSYGVLSMVNILLKNGANINSQNNIGMTSLHGAVLNPANVDITRLLLAKGANVNLCDYKEQSPLNYAVACNIDNSENIKLLLNAGADINLKDIHGDSILLASMEHINIELIKMLLEFGHHPDEANDEGITPLHLAMMYNDSESIDLLLKSGANVNKLDNNGNGMLHYIAWLEHGIIPNIVFDLGLDINAVNLACKTPLHIAAEGCKNDLKKLLSHGAQIDCLDSEGNTALLLSIEEKNKIENIETLLEHGANANIKNNNGISPLSKAKQYKLNQVIDLLLQYGAKDI
jgi:ankyrin repeat protein